MTKVLQRPEAGSKVVDVRLHLDGLMESVRRALRGVRNHLMQILNLYLISGGIFFVKCVVVGIQV